MKARLTPDEAATLLRVSRTRVYDLMKLGALIEGVHYARPPHMLPRFDKAALRGFLNGDKPAAVRSSRGRHGAKVNLNAVA